MAEHEKKNNNVPKLLQVTLEEHESFNNVIATATVASTSLEKKIAELFGSIFVDFEGCKIVPMGVPGGETLKCKVYFKPCFNKGEEGFYAVKVKGEDLSPTKKKTVPLVDLVNTVNMLAASKQFDLEDNAKEILSEFLIIPPDATKVEDRYNEELKKTVKIRLPKNWNSYTEEITDMVNGTRFQTPYLVVNLDLIPIVAKLYGKKDADELKTFAERGAIPRDRYQYSVNIVKVLNASMRQYVLEIRRIDIKEMEKLSQSIGYGMVTGNIVMTRR